MLTPLPLWQHLEWWWIGFFWPLDSFGIVAGIVTGIVTGIMTL